MNTNTGRIADLDEVTKQLYADEVKRLEGNLGVGDMQPDPKKLLAKARAEGWVDVEIGGIVGPINNWMWEVLSADIEAQSITIKPHHKDTSPSPEKRRRARSKRKKRGKGSRQRKR